MMLMMIMMIMTGKPKYFYRIPNDQISAKLLALALRPYRGFMYFPQITVGFYVVVEN